MENETLNRLQELASDLDYAKKREKEFSANRIVIEKEIAELIPGPEKGQKTVTLSDGSKLVIIRDLSYKANLEAIDDVFTGAEYPPPIKTQTTRSLDLQGYEWYRANHPGVFKLIAKHVEVKPRKTAVTYKPKKE